MTTGERQNSSDPSTLAIRAIAEAAESVQTLARENDRLQVECDRLGRENGALCDTIYDHEQTIADLRRELDAATVAVAELRGMVERAHCEPAESGVEVAS